MSVVGFILGWAALYCLHIAVNGTSNPPDVQVATELDPTQGRPSALGGPFASTGAQVDPVTTSSLEEKPPLISNYS
jgi:hypothetical protein